MQTELLIEQLTPSEARISESISEDGKNCYLSGIFMQADIQNRNGRTYPITEISNAVHNAKERISEQNGIFGELDHPQSLQINLDRISHVITEMDMNGSNAVGKAKMLDTPMGQIAKELIKSGCRLGVSSRGAGTVAESGGVQGFQFVTVDLVAQPSAPGAMPDTVYESLMSSVHGQESLTLAEQVKQDPAAQKYFIKEFTKFLNEVQFTKK